MLPGQILHAQKFLVLTEPNFSFVAAAAAYLFGVISIARSKDMKILFMFSPYSFIILDLIFGSSVCFQLIFVWGVGWELRGKDRQTLRTHWPDSVAKMVSELQVQ